MVKINWIEFENLDTKLKCERVNFNDDITLLVGLSGVGKSQILNAIGMSCSVATDRQTRLFPLCATINFTIGQKIYEWSYRIEEDNTKENMNFSKKQYEFVFEELLIDNEQVLMRNKNDIQLKHFDKIPTPKKSESLLSQYSNEEIYHDIVVDFHKIAPLDIDMDIRGMISKESFIEFNQRLNNFFSKENEQSKLDELPLSELPPIIKLYLSKKYFNNTYVLIFNYVKELFPEITDIDVIEDEQRQAYGVSIDVYDHKILQKDISNGMLKTIYYIVELVTAPENSLILIDEFENGLGVNCIDTLSELLLNERKDIQFIITSHHPKIIGEIPSVKWRIIERDMSVIKNVTSKEFGVDDSMHNAYFNLLNRWESEGKI